MNNFGIEFQKLGEMSYFDLPDPPLPGPTEILTRTRFSGVTNGTERHGLMADFGSRYPARSGYQHVSVIEAVGSRVNAFAVGDTVFLGNHGGHRGGTLLILPPPTNASGSASNCRPKSSMNSAPSLVSQALASDTRGASAWLRPCEFGLPVWDLSASRWPKPLAPSAPMSPSPTSTRAGLKSPQNLALTAWWISPILPAMKCWCKVGGYLRYVIRR